MRDHDRPKEQKSHKDSSKLTPEHDNRKRHLWYDFLRTYLVQFNRQKVIGNVIVDFYSHETKLIIELDGSQHFEEENQKNDEERE